MPYLCQVRITGPTPDPDGVSQMMDAVSDAIQAGWEAPRVVTDDDADLTGAPASDLTREITGGEGDSPDGAILDYQVLGYPGGAIIVVVLDSGDLTQTAVAATGLAQHLTTWSPGMLEYSPGEVSISQLDEPYDEENWLPPLIDESDEDVAEDPRWPMAGLLDGELRSLSAEYLLARAVRSLWDPTESSRDAWNVAARAVEYPWGGELTRALGVLLVRAARFEAARLETEGAAAAKLIVRGSGTPELAGELLRLARETAAEPGNESDESRGHLLTERFIEEHDLGWNRVTEGEAPDEAEGRSDRQLRALLWAGLRALATLTFSLKDCTGPWQVLEQLDGKPLVSFLAGEEEARNEEDTEEDLEETEAAAAALVLVWLAITEPGLLDRAPDWLLQEVRENGGSFHHVVYHALLLAGTGPVNAAVAAMTVPDWIDRIRPDVEAFATALAATADSDAIDPYDDMHAALERILAPDMPDLDSRIRYVLQVIGLAAEFTGTAVNTRLAKPGAIASARQLAEYLLAHPAMHAALVLHRDDDDSAVRTRALSLAAQVAPTAAGALAADFPGLSGDDPRLEPASRTQVLHWIEEAVRAAGGKVRSENDLECGEDARALAVTVMNGGDLPDWPARRLVAAGAEGAAAVLHAAGAADLADDVFGAV
ncbi:MAG TPA: hypothetical protein VG142_04800 [Trebonia sp.]|jgi:hypothetical protein|nr:hypothetical protein [Trebonia sp.]